MTERTADAANDVGLAWFRVAVLYFLIAVVIGISMGMRENFSLLSVHSHMNLLGWEALLNTRGTTWRKLPAEETRVVDGTRARELMLAHPALIKRPVFDLGDGIVIGFKPADQQKVRSALS